MLDFWPRDWSQRLGKDHAIHLGRFSELRDRSRPIWTIFADLRVYDPIQYLRLQPCDIGTSETDQTSALGIDEMSAFETRQTSAPETGQMSAAATGQMSSAERIDVCCCDKTDVKY